MAYRVRVKVQELMAYTLERQRIPIAAGDYIVEAGLWFDAAQRAGEALYFRCADPRDKGQLAVRLAEYAALRTFPNVPGDAPLELLE